MLVCCGEMGRSPKINAKGGRDHWGRLAPLIFYGGGLKTGQVIGQSDRQGGEPASSPITMDHLTTTILHSLLDLNQVRVMDGLSSDLLSTMTGNSVIRGLI